MRTITIKHVLILGMIAGFVFAGCNKDDENPTGSENHAPVVQSVVATPSTVNPVGLTDLTCSATDADQDELSYVWTYSGGSILQPQTGPSAQWQAPEDEGTYTISVTATDGIDTGQGSVEVVVDAEAPSEPSDPDPQDNATDVGVLLSISLSWTSTDPNNDPLTYDVYFGTITDPPLLSSEQTSSTYDLETIAGNTTYYWKIVSKDDHDNVVEGPVWSFTTENLPPSLPYDPYPIDNADIVSSDIVLEWSCDDPDGDTLIYDVYFGTITDPPLLSSEQTSSTYNLETIAGNTTYYWKIVSKDDHDNVVEGPVWSFTTGFLFWQTLSGHSSGVVSIAFSPDGSTLASGGMDETIKLWNVSPGSEIRTLAGHSNRVYSVAFSPDGTTLASGSWDNTIKIWNVSDGSLIHTLTGHSDIVYSVAYSPDGSTVASGSNDNTIKLWNLSDGSEIRTLTGNISRVYSVAFSPDGTTLASGSGFGDIIKLWNVSDGSEIRTLSSGYSHAVYSVVFSPDGSILASGSGNSTIKLWNVSDGSQIRTLSSGYSFEVNSVVFSPDGSTLASGHSYDLGGKIKLWNVSDGGEIQTLNMVFEDVSSVAFSPDGRTLASAGWLTGSIFLWR